MSDALHRAAEAIRGARCAIALTGAGISVESGIPPFRGKGGLWLKYPPEEYASIDGYLRNPGKVWRFWLELAQTLGGCRPSPAHYALAELESAGRLEAVITQNVDRLHQEAGSNNVIEFHGNFSRLACLDCGATRPTDLEHLDERPPRCHVCSGLMKPGFVMFGEMIPTDALIEADRLAQVCDVVLVVGTSANVFPAASVPITAKRHRAFIIESNIEPTEFTESVTDAFLEGPAGEVLPRLVELV
ncbi:MAG: NAD-dependent deacylase [Candidatus Hydrogenedentes bacterium]|nr:NAD-dependent deacylase [Candidatus Hydrogenedentota bacterium]